MILEENPLANLKVLYGTGAIRLDDDNVPQRVGGVKYTMKDGILYDAKHLLADVAEMVRLAKEEEGREIVQPGMPGDMIPSEEEEAGEEASDDEAVGAEEAPEAD